MNTLTVVFFAVLFGVVLLTGMIRLVLFLVRRRLLRRARERFPESEIVRLSPDANYFGRKTRGVAQVRGNGVLVLTRRELWFSLAAPRKDTAIPLRDIISVRIENSFLYKTVFRPLLVVRFSFEGDHDEIGWWVPDAELWMREIESLRSRG